MAAAGNMNNARLNVALQQLQQQVQNNNPAAFAAAFAQALGPILQGIAGGQIAAAPAGGQFAAVANQANQLAAGAPVMVQAENNALSKMITAWMCQCNLPQNAQARDPNDPFQPEEELPQLADGQPVVPRFRQTLEVYGLLMVLLGDIDRYRQPRETRIGTLADELSTAGDHNLMEDRPSQLQARVLATIFVTMVDMLVEAPKPQGWFNKVNMRGLFLLMIFPHYDYTQIENNYANPFFFCRPLVPFAINLIALCFVYAGLKRKGTFEDAGNLDPDVLFQYELAKFVKGFRLWSPIARELFAGRDMSAIIADTAAAKLIAKANVSEPDDLLATGADDLLRTTAVCTSLELRNRLIKWFLPLFLKASTTKLGRREHSPEVAQNNNEDSNLSMPMKKKQKKPEAPKGNSSAFYENAAKKLLKNGVSYGKGAVSRLAGYLASAGTTSRPPPNHPVGKWMHEMETARRGLLPNPR